MNHKYMSIGKTSKLTGVHVKSLRYYDEIGVLKPAYIDHSTGYRYYSEQQLIVIDTIKFCIEMGIPLKDFHKMLSDDGKKINFAKVVTYGTTIAKEKIKTIKGKLELLDEFREEILRADTICTSDDAIACEMPEKLYGVVPFKFRRENFSFGRELDNLLLKAKSLGVNIGYEMGLLKLYKKDGIHQFIFVELKGKKNHKELQTLTISKGEFLCKKSSNVGIEKAEIYFSELFKDKKEKIVIETELFIADYDVMNPVFELRLGNL